MWTNYLKIALRNLRRVPMFAAISIGGLAISLAACLLIAAFVRYELSYDEFFPEAERLYRTTMQGSENGGHARSPRGLADALHTRFPEIEDATAVMPVHPGSKEILRYENEGLQAGPIFRVDSLFFQVFPFRFIHGNSGTALSAPNQVVITKDLADRLFGGEHPLGRTFVHQRDGDRYTVTGVIENVPPNCHFDFEALLSGGSSMSDGIQWNVTGPFTYLKIAPEADPHQLETKIRRLEEASEPEFMRDQNLRLQRVTDIHLYSSLSEDIAPQSDIIYLYMAGFVGIIILLLACINYANLGTALSLRRAGEVGIRQAMGARRRQIAGQFLGESLLLACLALPLAFGLARLLLPLAPRVIDREIPAHFLNDPAVLLSGGLLVVVAGLFSGLYPAIVSMRMNPADILPGRSVRSPAHAGILSKALITFQFAVSAGLIGATLVAWFQLDFVNDRELGFDAENVLVLNVPPELSSRVNAFLDEVAGDPAVMHATLGPPPGQGSEWMRSRQEDPATGETWEYATLSVHTDYLETVGVRLAAGRDFRPEEITDSSRVVLVSRAAAERFGIAKDPIGQQIEVRGLQARGSQRRVIGVFDEFHNRSLHQATFPKILVPYSPKAPAGVLVRLQPGTVDRGLTHVWQVWEQFLPYHPMSYQFLGDQLRQLYEEERRLTRMLGFSALLALGIACLGLFGLAAITAARRTREMAIRKVLGATAAELVGLMSRQFLVLAAVGFLMAAPLVYLGMNRWLQQFAYRTEIGPKVFLLTSGIVVAVAFLTVSYQSIKAALTNPADSLRYE